MKKYLVITKSGSVYRLLHINRIVRESNLIVDPVVSTAISERSPVAYISTSTDAHDSPDFYDEGKRAWIIPRRAIKNAVGKYLIFVGLGGHINAIKEIYEEM